MAEDNKKTENLNNTINQLDLKDIYRTCHPTGEEHVFFLNKCGTFSRTINYVKTSLDKLKVKLYKVCFPIRMKLN